MHDTRASELRSIPSPLRIFVLSTVGSLSVFAVSLALQWIAYRGWLQQRGAIRPVGSLIAGAVTFAFAYRCQTAARHRRLELLHRFEVIAWANDRIRNALQRIACATYFHDDQAAMAPVLDAVETIEGVLREVLAKSHPSLHSAQPKTTGEREESGPGI